MQRWMKINKLRARIKETKARLAETQSEYKRFAELVKENSECEHESRLNDISMDLCFFLCRHLENAIE